MSASKKTSPSKLTVFLNDYSLSKEPSTLGKSSTGDALLNQYSASKTGGKIGGAGNDPLNAYSASKCGWTFGSSK